MYDIYSGIMPVIYTKQLPLLADKEWDTAVYGLLCLICLTLLLKVLKYETVV